jgi:hypothetical protein
MAATADAMDEIRKTGKGEADRPLLRSLLRTEILVALPTLVISIALAYFSFVQADASRKMQESGTWPYVSYGTSNSSPEGKDEISFSLSNDGVGPARLKEMEFLYKGKPMRNPVDFVRNCCAATALAVSKNFTYTTDDIDGVLRAGEQRRFVRFAKTDANAPLWNQLNDERWKVVIRSCYCSIFDECWVLDSRKEDPDQVKACPADWTKFDIGTNLSRAAAAAR